MPSTSQNLSNPADVTVKERSALTKSILLAAVGITISIGAALWLIGIETDRQRAELARQAEQAKGIIAYRFAQYETLINASRSLFAGSTDLNRNAWQRFSQGILEQQEFAGLSGVSRVVRIPLDQLDELQAEIRASGLEPATVNLHDQAWVCPILFNEPIERNLISIGLDICQVERLASALQASLEDYDIAVSQRLSLVASDGTRRPGYVMLAWAPAELSENKLHQNGWVSVSILAESLFSLPPFQDQTMRLEVIDLGGPEPVIAYQSGGSEDLEITDRQPAVSDIANLDHATDGGINYAQSLNVGGRAWTLRVSQPLRMGYGPWFALSFGLIASTLAAATLFLLLSHRTRAERLALEKTQALRENSELLSSITNNISEGIYRGDPRAGLIYANRALAKMFCYDSPAAMLVDREPVRFADPKQRKELRRLLESQGYYVNAEIVFKRADGTHFTGINSAVADRDKNGRIRHFDGAIYDITERKLAEQEVFRLAHFDALTGLPNRIMLNDHLATNISLAGRTGTSLAVLFIDLDDFKVINDSLGHELGDRVLRLVAQRMRETLRESDLLSRQGGDEFLIVLNPANAEQAELTAQRLLNSMQKPFEIDDYELSVSTSIGIALFPDDAQTSSELIRNADAAMYLAKDKGRSNFRFFIPELNQLAHDRLLMENEIREALQRGDFELHYQPQMDLESGQIVGLEALLRWQHREHGVISPDTFVPVAERSALIVQIGDWVINQACRQRSEWRQTSLAHIPISINVSAVQFWRGTLLESLTKALEDHQIDPGMLTIELTESALMQDAEQAGCIIEAINATGVQVTIDDFGTGHSSLAYLKRFRIAGLKIDRSFVSDIATDPDDAAIVSAILSIAEDLKLEAVAEGVDDPVQIPILKAKGCRLAQGFLFSPALPAVELIDWVRTKTNQTNQTK